jgi:hypothetical protein
MITGSCVVLEQEEKKVRRRARRTPLLMSCLTLSQFISRGINCFINLVNQFHIDTGKGYPKGLFVNGYGSNAFFMQ